MRLLMSIAQSFNSFFLEKLNSRKKILLNLLYIRKIRKPEFQVEIVDLFWNCPYPQGPPLSRQLASAGSTCSTYRKEQD